MIMSKPIVDIIIPNYNKGPFLDECINSVINQSYEYWSLFIIDDCSTDNSSQILDKYKNRKNFKIIKLNKNKGPSFCRNLGMRVSKSDYMAFLDSDDLWTENKLKNQISFMIDNSINFTYSDYTSFVIKNNKRIYKKKTNLKNSLNFHEFISNSSINSSTMIITRKLVGTNKFKRVGLLEDYLFKCDILKNNHLAQKINQNLAFYRLLPNNRSSNRFSNLYWLWKINNIYNKLSFFNNIKSIIGIIVNSIRKYGIK